MNQFHGILFCCLGFMEKNLWIKLFLEPLLDDAGLLQLVDDPIEVGLPWAVLPGAGDHASAAT